MAFVLKKLNKLPVRVKGTLPGEDGKPMNFDFTLHCKRLSQDEIDAVIADKESTLQDFVRNVAEGWDDVLGDDKQPISFGQESLDGMLGNAGLPTLCFQAYLKQIGAVAKN